MPAASLRLPRFEYAPDWIPRRSRRPAQHHSQSRSAYDTLSSSTFSVAMGDLSKRGRQNTWDAYEDILQTLGFLDCFVINRPFLLARQLHKLCWPSSPTWLKSEIRLWASRGGRYAYLGSARFTSFSRRALRSLNMLGCFFFFSPTPLARAVGNRLDDITRLKRS